MRSIFFLSFLGFFCSSYGPPNCFLYEENPDCYQACKEAEIAITFPQGSKASQEHFIKSITLCNSFDYSHYEKSVPFAKRGLMNEWLPMLNVALELNPEEYLAIRGWYHFFFMKNYSLAIEDIQKFDSLVEYDIGFTGDGTYHLNIMLGLCYKGLGNKEKAIEVIEGQLNDENYEPSIYDFLHLGVLYLETENYPKATESLKRQVEINPISEVYYYMALVKKAEQKLHSAKGNLEMALKLYDTDITMENGYIELADEIYRADILNAMKSINKK
ncbi:MAG: hypothetical protein MK105_05375 [Crocinitomicaceae bacterium]|nr:hypothetical protein [Crocinitomicaceae bacterium]